MLQAAGLSDYLKDPSLVATVFVPTNDAFNKALSQYGVTPSQALQQASLIKGVSFAASTSAYDVTLCHLGSCNATVLFTA